MLLSSETAIAMQKSFSSKCPFFATGVFVDLAHFDKHSVKDTRKESPAEKNFGVVLQDTVKATFRMRDLTKRWTQSGPIFENYGTFFNFL